MIRVAWHPLAKRELFEAQDFYDARVLGLGDIFLDRVEEAIALIRRYPHSGPSEAPGLRRIKTPRFPYGLIYRLEEGRIFILALAHEKRKPRYWARRV